MSDTAKCIMIALAILAAVMVLQSMQTPHGDPCGNNCDVSGYYNGGNP